MKLKSCCQKKIEDIRECMERGRILGKVVASSPFAVMFGAGAVDHAQAYAAGVHLNQTDWSLLREAVRGAKAVTRNRCQLIALDHMVRHLGEGEVESFWKKLADSFQN